MSARASQRAYDNSWAKLDRGDLEGAAHDADAGLRSNPLSNSDWHWRFVALKAEILLRQGQNNQALAMLEANPPQSLDAADVLVWRKLTQGAATAYLSRFPESQQFLAEAETLARMRQPSLLGEVALRKGTLASLQGDLPSSESAYRQALRLSREAKQPFLETAALGSLGLVAMQEEHYDEAIDWNRAALNLSRSIGAQGSLARIFGNMGWSLRELGDYEGALEDYRQAEDISARSGQIGDQVYWLTGISSVHYREHDYVSAESVLKQGLGLARSQDDKTITTAYLNDLAALALDAKELDAAEAYNKEASSIEQASHDPFGVLDTMLITGRVQETKRNFPDATQAFEKVIADPLATAPQRWEAQARLAGVYVDQGLDAKAENSFRRTLSIVDTARSSIQAEDLRLSFLAGAISFYNDYVGFLVSHHRDEEALEVAELSRARTLQDGLGTQTQVAFPLRNFQPREIARRANAVLLFYWLGTERSYLWVITPAKVTCLTLPATAEIDRLVKSYRDAAVGGRDVLQPPDENGARLYATLVEPAKELIPRDSRVIVLPDGSLYGLNFETLLVPGATPHFWIEDVTLTTASSLTLLGAANARSSPKEGRLLLVGNTAQPAPEFPALRQAGAEIERVQRYFPESQRQVLSGSQATPGAVLGSEPGKFAFVHFVTHGTASRSHPLDSAVILSSDGDSYKLYARDIVKHPLSAYLVTISACNGSGTRAYSGEGLVGLSWAFLRAGAHNVIGALWEVSDTSTPDLMDKLYAGLTRGQNPAAALRAAKLSLLHSGSIYRKPFYWAPFQLYTGS